MKENNKSVLTIIAVVIAAVLFLSCSVVFYKVYGNKSETDGNAEKKYDVPGFKTALSFTDTGKTYDGTDKIYKTELKDGRTIYLVTAGYDGFSQRALIGAFFEDTKLLGVTVISREGIPSFYDDRALGSGYLSQFCGTLSTNPDLKSADRKFIEIEPLSENDRAGTALLESVDICCEAYFKTILKGGGQ